MSTQHSTLEGEHLPPSFDYSPWIQHQHHTSSPINNVSPGERTSGQANLFHFNFHSMNQTLPTQQQQPQPQYQYSQQHQQQQQHIHQSSISDYQHVTSQSPYQIIKQQQQQQQHEDTVPKEQLICFVIQEIFNFLKDDTFHSSEGSINGTVRQIVSSLIETFNENRVISSDEYREELFSQFALCIFEMIQEPELVILKEQQLDNTTLMLKFQAHLKLLRVRALLVFLLFQMDSGRSRLKSNTLLNSLVNRGDLMIDLEALASVSATKFVTELNTIAHLIRFNVGTAGCNLSSGTHVNIDCSLVNNNMNHIALHSTADDRLVASFNSLKIASVDAKEGYHSDLRLKMRLFVHIGKYMTFAKCGQLMIPLNPGTSQPSEFNSSKIKVKKLTQEPNKQINIMWNTDFFVTPGRQKTDIYFEVECADKSSGLVDSVFIDHMRVKIPSYATNRIVAVRRNGCNIGEGDVLSAAFTPSNDIWSSSQFNVNNKRTHEEISKEESPTSRRIPLMNTLLSPDQQQRQLTTLQAQYMTSSTNLSIEEINEQSRQNAARKRPKLESSREKPVLQAIRDVCGFSLLHIAAFFGFTQLCKYLLNPGALEVDLTDNYLYTAYQWACYSGRAETACCLLSNGASSKIRNIHLCNGLDLAENQNHYDLMHIVEGELQRQAGRTLFDLFTSTTAKSNKENSEPAGQYIEATAESKGGSQNGSPLEDDKVKKQKKGAIKQQQLVPTQGKGLRRNSTGTGTKRGTAKAVCQPATLIKKTPKGADEKEQIMDLFIKPSRKKRTYISFFPKELCSSPYKYDILLRIPLHFTNQFNEHQFTFQLLLQDNNQQWTPVKQAVEVVKYLRTMFPVNYREIEWRIMFKVCSFHFHRKPFKLQVVYNSNLSANDSTTTLGNNTGSPTSTHSNPGSPSHTDGGPGMDYETAPHTNATESTNGNNVQGLNGGGILADNSVVFESQPFWVVARKKKDWDEFSETNDS